MNEQGPELQDYATVESPPAVDRFRQAKLDWLVKEKLFTADEFHQLSPDEIDELLATEFDPYYHQNSKKPEDIQEKGVGQTAEEVVVDFINELQLGGISAEKASVALDHGPDKTDIQLHVPGSDTAVNLQLTMRRDEGVAKKFNALVENTIPVILPGNVLEVAKKHNVASMRSVVSDVLRQVLQGMRARPYYRAELHALEQAFLNSNKSSRLERH